MNEPQPTQPATAHGGRTRVAIVFGGRSTEHVISCATAASVLKAIDRSRYEVLPIGISRDGQWVLAADDPAALELRPGHMPEVVAATGQVVLPLGDVDHGLRVLEAGEAPRELGDVDVVFPLLHGPFGEDGTLQGLLELAGVRYVGCGVTSSAVMMDKAFMKTVFKDAGLPVGPYVVIPDRRWLTDREGALAECAELQLPLFVKPCRAGSSFGVSKVDDLADLPAAVEAAREHDPKVIVEQGIAGREVECGVLQGRGAEPPRVSAIGEIAVVEGHGHAFYDFEAKYLDESSVRLSCPADMPEADAARMREMAALAFEAADCEGLSRVDFFYTPEGELYLNEINTLPGFTPYSMYPQVWAASGIDYPSLIDELIQLALERRVGLR